MEKKTIGFIGGGRITKITLQAFRNENVSFDSIVVNDTNPAVLNALNEQFPKIKRADSATAPAKQDVVVLALHPPVIMEILETIKDEINESAIIISFAPKITIEKIAMKLGNKNIVRMIPNATSWINEGYNPICFSDGFSTRDRSYILDVFETLGYTFETDEQKLESYAIISAMLPTYFWFQWQELEKIGVKTGLDIQETKDALRETLSAAIHLFYSPKLSHEEVMDLIPVKPVAEHEQAIRDCFNSKLLSLFEKIKPMQAHV